MKPRRLSKLQLLRELRKILIDPEVRLIKKKMKNVHGETTWYKERTSEGDEIFSNITISIDVRRDNSVSVVLHELLHVYLAKDPTFDKKWMIDLEEAIILGLEHCLYKYLKLPNNEKLLESWSKAIERKLQ